MLFYLFCRLTDPKTKKTYCVRIGLQVWLKPGSYKVGPQSLGCDEQIDPKFKNNELEWSTKERGSIMLQSLPDFWSILTMITGQVMDFFLFWVKNSLTLICCGPTSFNLNK
jgi:hypothetical protein